eukprot:g71138.t1
MNTASNLTKESLYLPRGRWRTPCTLRVQLAHEPLSPPPLPRRAGANARTYAIRLLSDNFCAGPPPGASFVDGGEVALVLGPEACWQPRAFRLRREGRLYWPRRDWALSACCGRPAWGSRAGGTRYGVMLRRATTPTDATQLWTYNAQRGRADHPIQLRPHVGLEH